MRNLLNSIACMGIAWTLGACAPTYQERGYLVHNDSRYDAVTDPSLLFDAAGGEPITELVFDSSELGIERGFLRYRILQGERYLTVHALPDPRFRLPRGRYRFAIQAIEFSTYLSGTRVTYGYPEVVDVELADHERIVVHLAPLESGGIRAELERTEMTSVPDRGAH